MKHTMRPLFTLAALLIVAQWAFCQQHDRHWLGKTWDQYKVVTMRFDEDSIGYNVSPEQSLVMIEWGSLAMSNAAGELQFYTNGNAVASWDNNIMLGGKGFNEGSPLAAFILIIQK